MAVIGIVREWNEEGWGRLSVPGSQCWTAPPAPSACIRGQIRLGDLSGDPLRRFVAYSRIPPTTLGPKPELSRNGFVRPAGGGSEVELARAGQHRAAGSFDVLIAAFALTYRATVLHHDRDYDVIASVMDLSVERVSGV